MGRSKIEWTECTWNPVTGCTKVSSGCVNCYAERMAKRLQAMRQPNYRNGFALTTHPHMVGIPSSWRKPRLVFVCSMSDLFHRDVPDAFLFDVFESMRAAERHTFQVLTKRSARLASFSQSIEWPQNVWAGVTVEDTASIYRIEHLSLVDAPVRFLSIEPLLESLPRLDLSSVDWVIVGGESGPGARPLLGDWVVGLRDQCLEVDVPFFFKQWGGVQKKRNGRLLEGRVWAQTPMTPSYFPNAAAIPMPG